MNFQSHHTSYKDLHSKTQGLLSSFIFCLCDLYAIICPHKATYLCPDKASTWMPLWFCTCFFSTKSTWIFLRLLVDTCSSFPLGSRVFPLPRPCWFSLTASLLLFWIPWTSHILTSEHTPMCAPQCPDGFSSRKWHRKCILFLHFVITMSEKTLHVNTCKCASFLCSFQYLF